MSVSPHSHTGQASVSTNTLQVRFGLEGMEEFYMAFKEKHVIHAEAQFDAESFKITCLDIYHQIGTCDCGPFTIPVDPYLPELVWEFYASYRARQQLTKRRGHTEVSMPHIDMGVRTRANLIAKGRPQWATSKGLIHRHDLKFEARMWLDLVCSRLMPSLNTLEVLIEVDIILSCIMDHVHINAGEIIADQFK
ncbi:hypothetical protein HAX54_017974 [Datura stramonium]|uniref:Putative plant transposon protein domain-containing protein n=1 Tax=Datura stramonium TaxID=4076 RepID=A0ABS8ULL9_DATST|nr:hypothetical protein [Datura stramonium]